MRSRIKIELFDPRNLNPSAYNPRKISARSMMQLRKSLRKFGFIDPVQVRADGNAIIGGHQRVKAAILEKLITIPVIRLPLSDQEAKLLNLTLNAEYGTVDVQKLTFLLQELKLDGADLELTGYDAKEIDDLSADVESVTSGKDKRTQEQLDDDERTLGESVLLICYRSAALAAKIEKALNSNGLADSARIVRDRCLGAKAC